jgi:hypothetical protein
MPPAQKVFEVTVIGVAMFVLRSYDVPQAGRVVPSDVVTDNELFSVSATGQQLPLGPSRGGARLTVEDEDGIFRPEKHHLC